MGNLVAQAELRFKSTIDAAVAQVDQINANISNLSSQINGVNAQITSKQAELQTHLDTATQNQQWYDQRYNCGWGKPPCHNYLDARNAANTRAETCRQQIAALTQQRDGLIAQRTTASNELIKAKEQLSMVQEQARAAIAEAQRLEQVAAQQQAAIEQASNPIYLQAQQTAQAQADALKIRLAEQETAQRNAELAAQQQTAKIEAEAEKEKAEEKNTLFAIVGTVIVIIVGLVVYIMRSSK